MRKKRLVVLALGSTLAAATLSLASCSLGLDESLIGEKPETGSADVSTTPDTFAPEGGDGALPPISPEAGVCTKDSDCKGTDGCFTAKCDLPRKACVLQVCRTVACSSATCDVPTQKCGAQKPYKFRATQFPVGVGIGCGGNFGRCFAAVYPFVFVGTTNGVIAFAADDPQNANPLQVPLSGLGFVPVQIIASGSRVYFLGSPVGTGATSRVPIAYADVPPSPFAPKIPVTTVLGTFNRPAADPLFLLPRGNDTALLVDGNLATAYASAPIEPPISEPAVFNSTGFAFTAASTPLAVSGSRLVMGQINAASAPVFGFVAAAGSATPSTSPDVTIATATPAQASQFFAQSADGAIFWSYVSLTSAPPGPPIPALRAAKGYFLVADSMANFDPTQGIDLEVYGGAPQGTPSIGPIALLDSKTALVTTANPANPGAVTNVKFVTRTPLAIVKNADTMPRLFTIPLAVSQLAAAGSNGLGYVLAIDPAAPTAPMVYVFDSACAP